MSLFTGKRSAVDNVPVVVLGFLSGENQMEHVSDYTTAEYVLGFGIIAFTILALARIALAYLFPKDTN
jgi:hypothetical protein